MTDPLLTIEDATREFRVSPKTIRRRLTSGEIAGAYKRPGQRGPEWVMPRESLAAAGFVPRPLEAPAALPTDVEERASYWERRALDAEAALRSAERATGGARDTGRRRGLGWLLIGVVLLASLLVALLAMARDHGSEVDGDPVTAGAMAMVVELLERVTEPGDAVGLVGERRNEAIPAGRVAAPSPSAGWQSSSGPRFVVATFEGGAPPRPVETLRSTAELVLRAPHAGMVVEVYDRRSPADEASGGASPTSSAPAGADTSDAPGEPSTDAAADPAPGDGAGEPVAPPRQPVAVPGPTGETDVSTAGRSPGEAQVAPGESFWAIAEAVVGDQLGPDAPQTTVTSYWSALVRANTDRLVDPGNPDLLHVGQTLLLPPLP